MNRFRTSRRTIINLAFLLIAAITITSLLVWYIQPRFILAWIATRNPDVLYFVATDDKTVALTIDDGPHATVTPRILDVLQGYSAHATFFVLGERIPGNESILERIRLEGHELANHLVADYPSILLRADEFEKQLIETEKRIGALGLSKWFRPGFGWFNARMLRQLERHGYRLCLASVYPHDTKVRMVPIISQYILTRAAPGDIIVLHDGTDDRMRTVAVLKAVLPELKRRGYEIVTVSELANLRGREGEPVKLSQACPWNAFLLMSSCASLYRIAVRSHI